ncbi:MAG: hypothetical protein ABEJ78_08715 [Haloferacaceae archaeon]
MADTKKGRDEQAHDEENRQRERELREARDRADESEPAAEDVTPTCHRRECNEPAAFVVLERYQEDTGKGAVEAEAFLCREHTDEESPTNLDGAYADYVFRVRPL